MLFSRLWALFIAVAFLLLWALSQDPNLPVALGSRVVGILGWGLVAAGFLGVALGTNLVEKPQKPRRLVRVAAAPRKPQKLPRSAYTPPPGQRFRRNVERRFYGSYPKG